MNEPTQNYDFVVERMITAHHELKQVSEEGRQHALAGGNVHGIDKYQSISERYAWFSGWLYGGGNIRTGESRVKSSYKKCPRENE